MSGERDNDDLQHLRARNAELEAKIASLTSANVALQHKVEVLLHQLYGKRSERREDNHPLLPFPGDEPEAPPPPHVEEAPDEDEAPP